MFMSLERSKENNFHGITLDEIIINYHCIAFGNQMCSLLVEFICPPLPLLDTRSNRRVQ